MLTCEEPTNTCMRIKGNLHIFSPGSMCEEHHIWSIVGSDCHWSSQRLNITPKHILRPSDKIYQVNFYEGVYKGEGAYQRQIQKISTRGAQSHQGHHDALRRGQVALEPSIRWGTFQPPGGGGHVPPW